MEDGGMRDGDARAAVIDDTDQLFEAVIVGAGASGLSLACHLAAAGWGENVLLVDDGAHPLNQRSWAWWSEGRELLAADASTQLDHLWVAGTCWQQRNALEPYAYRRITGPELSAATDRLIGTRPGYRRVAGSVRAVAREGDGCRVAIDLAEPGGVRTVEIGARWVFDSAGLGESPQSLAVDAYLDFYGLHVEYPTDVFDPGAVTLMDFRTDQSAGAAFVYVLPTSASSALVERTVFAFSDRYDREAEGERHEARVRDYLQEHVGAGDYRVTGREVGTIELHRKPADVRHGAVIPIGAKAGLVKASTGYGFGRIQCHSAAIAACLTRGESPAQAAPAHRWSRALDGALLRVLREDPAAAVEIFTALFTRNPAPRILAFLDEDASFLDQLRLFATLPLVAFARSQVNAVRASRR